MDEEIKKLLLQNLTKMVALETEVKKIRHYQIWQQVFGVIKVVVIVVPVVLAVLYAMPLFKQALTAYQSLIGGVSSLQNKTGQVNFMEILNGVNGNGKITEDQIKQFLK
ncbi:MAG: hypothetical protein AAB766_00360 [Patescibacteria group bacterium]